jgi:hypothetical protein
LAGDTPYSGEKFEVEIGNIIGKSNLSGSSLKLDGF